MSKLLLVKRFVNSLKRDRISSRPLFRAQLGLGDRTILLNLRIAKTTRLAAF